MADADNTLDDVYDDPDNILANEDDHVHGGVELPDEEKADLSQSIYNDELKGDDRGTIPELEESDKGDDDDDDPGELAEEETGSDVDKLGDMDSPDENDGAES